MRLSQLIAELDRHTVDTCADARESEGFRYLQVALAKPMGTPADLLPVFARAEVYSFTDDSLDAAAKLIDNGIEWRALLESLRLPSQRTWIEGTITSQGHKVRFGGMFDQTRPKSHPGKYDETDTLLTVCAHTLDLVRPAVLFDVVFGMPIKPIGKGFDVQIRWRNSRFRMRDERADDDEKDARAFQIVMERLLLGLFLVITPRVCEIKTAEKSEKLQRSRARSGKPPLIEYKQVKLAIGVGAGRYEQSVARSAGAGAVEDAIRKKLHHVVGHFRTYREGREQPLVSWVPDHWRGDAKLGVVLHERDVHRATQQKPPPQIDLEAAMMHVKQGEQR